ncbi:MAG: GspE/PulE family protein [Fimbriimonadaceae bacterium]
MGEKFSWDRLMKRGKGAEEDNTINMVLEKVEGPVAPLNSGAFPQQNHQKSAAPAAPPVVHGEAPPMNANRAPLVIDWEEFSKDEANLVTQASAPAFSEQIEATVEPIEKIEPIQIPTVEVTEPLAQTGNFWDKLNKQTQVAMGQTSETNIETEVRTPETAQPVVTGWDDVELTPREQAPADPSESDIMAGTLDPNGFQPISSTFQRPSEEEIKQKTDAIAQSNAWSESSTATPPPIPVEPPESPSFVQPEHQEVLSASTDLEPAEINAGESGDKVQTIDVGESKFMNRPPSGHYVIEDPFKPTGNKLLGADRPTTASPAEIPQTPVSRPWNQVDEFVAPTSFEKSENHSTESEESANFEAFESSETSGQLQETSPFQELVPDNTFENHVESVNEEVTSFESPNHFDSTFDISTPPAENGEVETNNYSNVTHSDFEEFLTPSELPVSYEAEPTSQAVENFDPIEVETAFEASQTTAEETFVTAPPFVEEQAKSPSVTSEEFLAVEPQQQATPADFWANIPGAQAQLTQSDNEQVSDNFEENSGQDLASVDPVSELDDESSADLERDLKAGELLVKHKLVAPAQLERALARQSSTKEKLGQVLISMGLISERRLLQVLASQKGVSPWHLEDDAPSQDALQLVSHETCQLFQVLPVAVRGDMLLLAMRETQDHEAIEAIRSASGKRIEPVLADEVRLAYTIDEAYGVARDRGESALEQMVAIAHEHETNLTDGTIVNPERPDHLNALLRELIADAKRKSATSITVGYGDGQGEILYRIHGRLCPVQSVPLDLATSVLKTAHADLEEQRIPFEIGADYKVAITTGQQGDNFVVTFPQAEAKLTALDEMLIEEENLKLLRELTLRPYGLFLITGSVRSTKQATMKALSQEMERQGRVVAQAPEGENIAEQINLAVTSESEVIVVGELENEADIRAAVKAASSGHLILAEVTANDATTAIQQLISDGADPYLLATILTGVWSQAIAPKLCLNCREAQNLTESERSLLDHYGMRHIQRVFESNGCESCNHTGVAGQIVLSEVLPVSSDVSHLIANKAPVEEMAEQAGFAGYLPMDFDAMTRVIHGDVDFDTARRLVLFSLRELSAISRRDSWETQAS